MIHTLSTHQAVDALMADEYAKWSYEAATAIVEWLEDLESDNPKEPMEFDPIAVRCDFSEYTATDLVEAYGMTLEEIRQRTLVLDLGTLTNRSFVIQQF
tara:strand:- start:725 stop:1021 length:297 start_codon:yes stop_codon:yes gene_type:complete